MQFYNVYQSGKRLYIDEKENPDNKIVVNKYDNMQQTLRLISDGTLPPRLYWALRNPKLSNKYFILKLVNNEDLIVGTDISATPGLWDMLLIGTDEDYIIEGTDIDQSRLTYVSDHFGRLFVRDNFLEELDFEEQCSPTFKVFYNEIIFQLSNKADKKDIPDKMSDLENDTNFISGVIAKDDGNGHVEIIGTTFSGGETEEGGGGSGDNIEVDDELNETSTNPVQNKVVTKEVNSLKQKDESLDKEVIALRERNAELEETIEKLQIKVTTDKASFHHITDSANMKVVDFGMSGITEQETTPGNQLFDLANSKGFVSLYTGLSTEIDVANNTLTTTNTHTTDRTGNLDLGILPAGTYYISFEDVNNYSESMAISYGELETGVTRITTIKNTGGSFTIEEELHCWVIKSIHNDNPFKLKNIMLNPGDTALPIEKYVGGMPSPNPDYKQEIKNAGVYNEETGRYEHKCCVGNKNFATEFIRGLLLDINGTISTKSTYYTDNYLCFKKILAKGTYTINIQGVKIKIARHIINSVYTNVSSIGMDKFTFTINDMSETIICFSKGDGSVFDGSELVQLEYGEIVTDYTPHASQQFTLTSDRPLTMWDNLVKVNGKWYWDYKQLKFVVDGDVWIDSTTDFKGFRISGINLPGKWNKREGYCNQLRVAKDTVTQNGLCIGIVNTLMYCVNNSYYDESLEDKGLANWKAHLNEHPLEIYTYKDESELVPLLDEEQTLLHNLETYYGVTNVYNEQGCPMWLTYVQSPQICMENVNKKIEEINNALLSLGANV